MKNSKYFHICWFADAKKYYRSKDPYIRRFWIQMILTRGKSKDIKEIKDEEIKENLNALFLPKEVRLLWERYFEHKKYK